MKPRSLRGRSALAFLAISAVLFAPGTYESPAGSSQAEQPPIGARVLAPTFREGMVAARDGTLQAGEDPTRVERFAFGIALASVPILLIVGSFVGGLRSRRRYPGHAFRWNPVLRAPPDMRSVSI